MSRDQRREAEGELENGETVEPKKEKRWKMCLYGERGWGLGGCQQVQPAEGGGPWKWLMRAVSTGNEDSLSGVGNEVSVVIKRKVSMAMQRAVCTENLLGVEGAK